MTSTTYLSRRSELETYFDRTASDAWAKLTSDAPVSGIRATVRAGRDEIRATLMSWLPANLEDARLLDAGCGAGQLSFAAARRGATVTAVDLAGTLLELARTRAAAEGLAGAVDFRVGDMCDAAFGQFDHVVAMDSLIHYRGGDITSALATFAERTSRSIVFTFAPRTPALSLMHAVGKLFPRGDRAPAIEPLSEADLRRRIAAAPALRAWTVGRTARVSKGFYISQAIELVRR